MAPTELIDAAVSQGFGVVSITDHDTADGYLAPLGSAGNSGSGTVLDYAKIRGIKLITGIELSCWWRFHPVHILAYGLEPASEFTARMCKMTQMARSKRVSLRWWPVQAMEICQLVRALGGVPVLAHPRFYWVRVPRMIAELVEYGGLIGIETEYEYRTHHLSLQCPIWTPGRIADIADAYGLVRTGGGDSHGRDLRKYRH
jgi:predicted metal-dependent phosphoesterase TrpH